MTETDAQRDQVELSESVVRAIEDAKFDAAKVEAAVAIMQGNYLPDAKRIAENMLDLENDRLPKPPASSPTDDFNPADARRGYAP